MLPAAETTPTAELLPDPAPSRGRLTALTYLCVLAGVLYLDRICIAKALPSIKDEFGLDNEQCSYFAMAFTLAYGLFEIPIGRMGDRIGSRKVLTRISLCWSLFTALTGACSGLYSLIVVRFLFGAGEAGAYPNAARVLARWFPNSERGRAQGLLVTAGQIGGVVAPPLAAYLIAFYGWRWTFAIFGLFGAIWAGSFWKWFRDDPGEHPQVNAAELRWIGKGNAPGGQHEPIPWRLVAGNFSIWVLAAVMVCSAFNSYFYFTWFPLYLEKARGVTNEVSGWLTALVLAGSAVGTLSGGAVADWIVRRGQNADRSRAIFCAAGYGVGAAVLWFAPRCDTAWGLSTVAAASCLAAFITIPSWWSCAIQVSGRHVGALFGLMNMMGVFGAMGSQYFVGKFTDWRAAQGFSGRAQWDPIFFVYVGVLAMAAACWWVYRSQPLEKDVGHK